MENFNINEYRKRRSEESPEFAEASEIVSVIGELIKLRFLAGLTQTEIAHRIGVPQPRVAEFEALDGRRVSLEFTVRYARALGASIKVQAPPPGIREAIATRPPARRNRRGMTVDAKSLNVPPGYAIKGDKLVKAEKKPMPAKYAAKKK